MARARANRLDDDRLLSSLGALAARIFAPYQVNEDLMAATGKDSTVFLHCLPAEIGQLIKCERLYVNNNRSVHQPKSTLDSFVPSLS